MGSSSNHDRAELECANLELRGSIRRDALIAAAIGVALFVVLFVTSPAMPMVWDEGNHLARAERVRAWFRLFASPDDPQGGVRALAPAVAAAHFPCTTVEEGHPALFLWLIASGRSCCEGPLAPLDAARLGTLLLAAISTGAMVFRLRREGWPIAGYAAAIALATQPRWFAHAHFATLDGPVTSAWLLVWATAPLARRGYAGGALWGVVWALCLSAKFTGWLALAPAGLAMLVTRGPRPWRGMLAAAGVGLLGFVLLNPGTWSNPIAGIATFFELNLNRAARPNHNITTLFLGQLYNLDYPLPWYNTLVWVAITLPCGTLLAVMAGAARSARAVAWRTASASEVAWPLHFELLAHAGTLLVVRALPGAPPHDGVRLFLPAFPFLAILAGVGIAWAWDVFAPRARRVLLAGSLAWALAGAFSVAWYFPQTLGYYSPLIGGQRGAVARGMEATYYWDALDGETLAWLRDHTIAGEKVAFAAISAENLEWLATWRRLPPIAMSGEQPRWYVVQRRPSAYWPQDAWLLEHRRPVFQKFIRNPEQGFGPWRLDVPLLDIYDGRDWLEAVRATQEARAGR